MRFRLIHLLLMFPAYGIAVFLAPFFYGQLPGHSSFGYAPNGVRSVRLTIIGCEEIRNGQRIPDDVLERWFVGNLTKKEQVDYSLYEYPGLDPWGRPYKHVRDIALSDGRLVETGVYSLGRDGVSESTGNDPDDVNTWAPFPSNVAYYIQEANAQTRYENATRGAYLAPFVFIGLVGTIWMFKRFRGRQPRRIR